MTINGADVNTSVTFTKKVETVNISVGTQKVGTGPTIVMRASGGGTKEVGSSCTISTTAQNYTDEYGSITYPNFMGWWNNGVCESMSENYTFTVTKSESYIAQWAWYR